MNIKKILSSLKGKWLKTGTGLAVIGLGTISMSLFDGQQHMQISMLNTLSSAQSGVSVYDLTNNDGDMIRPGELKPMVALDFTSSGGQLNTLNVKLETDIEGAFTDGGTTSKIIANLDDNTNSGLAVYMDMNNNDIFDNADQPIFDYSPGTFTTNEDGSAAVIEWNAPIPVTIESGKTIFVGVNIAEGGFDSGSNGSELSMSITDMTGPTSVSSFETASSENVYLDTIMPEIARVALDGAITAGTEMTILFDQAMIIPSGVSVTDLIHIEGGGTLGSGASYTTDQTLSSGDDTLVVTLGTGVDLEDKDIWVNVANSYNMYPHESILLDVLGPSVRMAWLDDSGDDGKYENHGDTLMIEFNEPIDPTTFDDAAIANSLSVDAGALHTDDYYNTAWLSDNLLAVMLTGLNTGNDVVGSNLTVDSSVKDMSGNAFAGSSVSISGELSVPRAEAVRKLEDVAGGDSMLNGNDIAVGFGYKPGALDGDEFIYVMLMESDIAATPPIGEFQPMNEFPITPTGQNISQNRVRFDGASESDLNTDAEGYPIMSGIEYRYHVVTCDAALAENPGATCTFSSSAPFEFDFFENFGGGDPEFFREVFIEGASPQWGSVVGPNLEDIVVKFSDPLDWTSIDEESVTLVDSNTNQIAGDATYLHGSRTIIFTLSESLLNDTDYRIRFSGIESEVGQDIGNMEIDFHSNAANDTTAPTKLYNNLNGARPIDDIFVQFDKAMDPSTLTSSNVSISPAANISLEYDVVGQTLIIIPNNGLQANTEYTITFTDTEDVFGNALSGTTVTGTTGNEVTDTPEIVMLDARERFIFFETHIPLRTSTITKSNININCAETGSVALGGANLAIWPGWNGGTSVNLDDIQLPPNDECTIALSDSVLGRNGVSADTTPTSFDVLSEHIGFAMGDDFGGTGFFEDDFFMGDGVNHDEMFGGEVYVEEWGSFGGFDDTFEERWMDPAVQMMTPIIAEPKISLTGTSTEYRIEFPFTSKIQNGDIINIRNFPTGTDASSASIDATIPMNLDVLGGAGVEDGGIDYPNGKMAITNVDYNPLRGLELTVSVDKDGDGVGDGNSSSHQAGMINLVISNITNGSVASEDSYGTNGYSLAIKTLRSGQEIEDIGDAMPFFLSQGGSGSIEGNVLTADLEQPIEDAICEIWSPHFHERTKTDSSGDCDFTGLPAGEYEFMVQAPTNGNYYERWSNSRMSIGTGETVVQTEYLDGGDYTLSGSISHPAFSQDQFLEVMAHGPDGMARTVVTANEGSSSTSYSLKLGTSGASEFWFVNVMPGFNPDAVMDFQSFDAPEFIPPRGQDVNVSENTTLNWTLSQPDARITGTVVDGGGNPVSNAWIDVMQTKEHFELEEGDVHFGGVGQPANPNGTFSIPVTDDEDYKVIVNAFGSSKEVSVRVTGGTGALGEVKMERADNTVSGRCLVGGEPTQCDVNIENTTTGEFTWARDDGDGWTAFVNNGSLRIEAFAHEYGRLGESTQTVNGSSISDINFNLDTANMANIAGTVVMNGLGVSNAHVWAEEYDPTSEWMEPVGNGRGTMTDRHGNYSLDMIANDSDNRIRLFVFHPDAEGMPPTEGIDISSEDQVVNFDPGDMHTVTVDLTGFTANNIRHMFVNLMGSNGQFAGMPIDNPSDSGTYSFLVPEGTAGTTYRVEAFADKFGRVLSDAGETPITVNSDKTISFDISGESFELMTVDVHVEDGSGSAVSDAGCELFGNFNHVFGETDSGGDVELKVRSGEYELHCFSPSYTSGSPTSVSGTGSHTVVLESADATITGTVTKDGNLVPDAFIFAEGSDGSWADTIANTQGEFTLNVQSGVEYSLTATTKSGTQGTEDSVAAGASGVEVVAETSVPFAPDFDPDSTPMDLATGGVADFPEANVKITAPAGAITGTADTDGQIVVRPAAPPVTATAQPMTAVDISAVAGSTTYSQFNEEVNLELEYDKTEIEELITEGTIGSDDLTSIQNAWYDPSLNTYKTIATTQSCTADTGSGLEAVDCDDLQTAVQGGNVLNDESMIDYEIKLASSVDHFTLFTSIVSNSESSPSVSSSGVQGASSFSHSSSNDTAEEVSEDSVSGESGAEEVTEEMLEEAVDSVIEELEEAIEEVVSYVSVDEAAGVVTFFVAPSSTFEVELDDMDGHWSEEYVNDLASRGVIDGFGLEDGRNMFLPDRDMTRAEVVKLIVRAMELPIPLEVAELQGSDVYPEDWFAPYIAAAVEAGLLDEAPEYRPNDRVNRAEALKLVLLGSSADLERVPSGFKLPFVDVPRVAWYRDYLKFAYFTGVISGYINDDNAREFRAGNNVTRAELVKMVSTQFEFDAEVAESAE